MKKVFTLMIGVVTTASAFSQLSIGVHATGNLSDASLKDLEVLLPNKKSRVLPGGGIVVDYALSPGLTLRSGVNYLQHGITMKAVIPGLPGEIDEIRADLKSNLNYLQVPVNLLFTTKGALKFFVGGGPYVSFGISGKSKVETTTKYSDGSIETEKEESDVFKKDETGEASFKRFDYGVGALAGIKLPGGLFAHVGYQYSLNNISNGDEGKYKNRGLQLTLGYYLFSK